MVRLIKRYGSRKLYDTEESRYVSLDEIGDFVRRGQEVRVLDNKSSEDVTAQTLAQVILENSRSGTSTPPSEVLHELIRRGGDLVSTGVEQFQQGVENVLQASIEKLGPIRRAREETAVLRKRLEELESSLEQMEDETAPTEQTALRKKKKAAKKSPAKTKTPPSQKASN